jgi:hypothetical protein
MASTNLIGLLLPATGTLSGQWGGAVNNAISQIVDAAVAGTQTISTDADVTLTVTEGAYNSTGLTATSAQYAIIRWTANGTVTRNITVPAQSKTYVVINDTAGIAEHCYSRGWPNHWRYHSSSRPSNCGLDGF